MKKSLLLGLIVGCGLSAAFVFPQEQATATNDQLLMELLTQQKKTNALLQSILGSPNPEAKFRKVEPTYPSIQTHYLEQISKGMGEMPEVLAKALSYESMRGTERLPYLATMKTTLEEILKEVKYR